MGGSDDVLFGGKLVKKKGSSHIFPDRFKHLYQIFISFITFLTSLTIRLQSLKAEDKRHAPSFNFNSKFAEENSGGMKNYQFYPLH